MRDSFLRTFCVAWAFSLPLFLFPLNGRATLENKHLQGAPDFTVTAKQVKGNLEIQATAPSLHHFNLQAPMSLKRLGTSSSQKPNQAQSQTISFKLEDASTAKYEVILYLCDDAKTYCEKRKVLAQWNSDQSQLQTQSADHDATNIKPILPSSEPTSSLQKQGQGQFGFIFNRPEEALSEARQKRKPLLIDFFGIWCPPCNELDEVVFSSPEFEKQSAGFVKLKLDSDSPESWNLKTKYKVAGYPTVILATPDGQEISRIVGFRSPQIFLSHMKNAFDLKSGASKNKKTDPAQLDTDRALVLKLSEKPSKSPQELKQLIESAKKALAKPESNNADDEFTNADLWALIAGSYDELHESKNSQSAWLKAAEEFRKRMTSGQERGLNLELAHCLWKARQFEAADKIYQNFEALYPKEFTFYFNHAAMKISQKKWSETETLARKALEFSYGDNQLRAAVLLVKTLKAQDRKLEAKELIETVLHSLPVPKDPHIRTHRYIKELKELG
jgi:thiol-disulfide isomerase/thioredoxin